MKLTIDRDPLLAAITRISGALERKGASPVFSHILLSATDDRLMLRAQSADMQATITFDARVSEAGDITAPGEEIAKIAAALQPGARSPSSATANVCWSSRGGRGGGCRPWPTDLMAEWPAADDTTALTLPARMLASALDRTLFAAAKDGNKGPTLQGVYVHGGEQGLSFVATDSHRLAVVRTGVETDMRGVVLAPRFVAEAVRVLDGSGDSILTLGVSRSELTYGPLRIVSKVLDGKYVSYERMMPSYADTITVSRADLTAALKRVNAVVTAVRRLKLSTADGAMHVDSRAMDGGEASDEMACERVGDAFTVLLNSGYLGEALGKLEEPNVTFGTGTAKQPVTIVEGDFTQLIVPQVVEAAE